MRFVVLLHENADGTHWDLMLETESGHALTTWALPPRPLPPDSFACPAQHLPDHRTAYLQYEGPVSNGRGTVTRIDEGTYEALGNGRYRLHGTLFCGELAVDERSNRLRFSRAERSDF